MFLFQTFNQLVEDLGVGGEEVVWVYCLVTTENATLSSTLGLVNWNTSWENLRNVITNTGQLSYKQPCVLS